MASTSELVPETAALAAAALLQELLPELMALSLEAKQAQWNLTGPAFLPLHDLTGRIAVDTRTWADRIAERAAALGFTVDARPQTVAAVASYFPSGRLMDASTVSSTAWPSAIVELGARIEHVAASAHARLGQLAINDAVAHDVTVAVVEGLQRYGWMLRAQAT
jgi:starvation-inducible DNA-binding protein